MGKDERPLIIGLTGAVAAGKSRAAEELRSLGAVVFDADREVGRLLQEAGVLERIAREVSVDAVADGALDRAALARVVFEDEAKRRRLEAILHPPVIAAAEALVATPPSDARAVALDVPLLIEAKLDELCDEVWFIDAPREERERRATERRGWARGELERREAAQLPLETKRDRADRVIDNAGTVEDLAREVRGAWEAALRARA